MRKFRNILGFLVIIFTLSVFMGCGVSKDDYDNVLAELDKTKSELQKANNKIAELEKSSIKIPKIDTETMAKLQAARQKGEELASKIKSLTSENKTLTDNLAKLKKMAGDLQEKLKAFQGQTKDLPFDFLKKP